MLLKKDNSFPSLEELLTSGGDARIICDARGINKYGCAPSPQPNVLSYSSSTASSISSTSYAAALKLYERLKNSAQTEAASVTYAREMNRVRSELIALCNLSTLSGLEIVFGASGTDLHLFIAQLLYAGDKPPFIIMSEPSETGSGVKAALEGHHFSTQTASGSKVNQGEAITGSEMQVVYVQSRLANGTLRSQSLIDSEVEALTTQAIAAGRHVLLVLTDVSKTGLITPSSACAVALKQQFPSNMDVMIDACQFRLANGTLRAYLEQDFLLAVTGSKFVAGPAFAAALLIPQAIAKRLSHNPLPAALNAYSTRADWPEGWAAQLALSDTANYGLLLRFEAALTELRAFHAISEPKIADFLKSFAVAIEEKLKTETAFELLSVREIKRESLVKNTSWDHIPTIFPFLLRHPISGILFTRDETARIYELMKEDLSSDPGISESERKMAVQQCLLGQPVVCGIRDGIELSALRLNMDMRLIVDALSPKGRGMVAVIAEALSVLDKVVMLAQNLEAFLT